MIPGGGGRAKGRMGDFLQEALMFDPDSKRQRTHDLKGNRSRIVRISLGFREETEGRNHIF